MGGGRLKLPLFAIFLLDMKDMKEFSKNLVHNDDEKTHFDLRGDQTGLEIGLQILDFFPPQTLGLGGWYQGHFHSHLTRNICGVLDGVFGGKVEQFSM